MKSSRSYYPHLVTIWTQVMLTFAGVDISGMNLLSWGPWPLCSQRQPPSGTIDQEGADGRPLTLNV